MKLGFRSRIFWSAAILVCIVALLSSAMIQRELEVWGVQQSKQDFLEQSRRVGDVLLGQAPRDRAALLPALGQATGTQMSLHTGAEHEGSPGGVSEAAGRWMVSIPLTGGQRLRAERPVGTLAPAQMGRLRWLLLYSGLLGIAAILALSVVATYLMSRTLRRLIAHAKELMRLEPAATGPWFEEGGDDEFGLVLTSMTSLSERVAESMRDLATERDRFERVLESMEEAIVALDGQMKIQLVNGVAKRFFASAIQAVGYDFEGRPLLDVIKHATLVEMVERVRVGEAQTVEAEMVLGGGGERVVISKLSRVGGRRGGCVLMCRDVSELRTLETVRRDFVANVSHELRTPASVIMLNSETLLGDPELVSGPVARRFVEGIYRNAERLAGIVNDLLDISRIEAGKFRLVLEPVGLFGAVLGVVDMLEERIEQRGQRVEVTVGLEVRVRADAKALDQMMYNLIDNASKYAPPDSEIVVRATSHEPHGGMEPMIRLEVCDQGPGLAPEHRPRIFERFYRVDDGRSRSAGGTGLGLSIVKLLAGAQGGHVGVKPNRPKGSVFWFTLPQALDVALDAAPEGQQE